METSNIVALTLGLLGFIISIIGHILTPRLNLRSKQLERRLEYRTLLFLKILDLWEVTHNQPGNQHGFEPLMKEVNKLIQLYGNNSEIKSFKEVVSGYNNFGTNQNEINRQTFHLKFNNFLSIAFNAYRKEICLEKLND